jgi:hypothetical protein
VAVVAQVCVQRPDGSTDEDFNEWYWHDDEGEEWRRVPSIAKHNRTLALTMTPSETPHASKPAPATTSAGAASGSAVGGPLVARGSSHGQSRVSLYTPCGTAGGTAGEEANEEDEVRRFLASARLSQYVAPSAHIVHALPPQVVLQ